MESGYKYGLPHQTVEAVIYGAPLVGTPVYAAPIDPPWPDTGRRPWEGGAPDFPVPDVSFQFSVPEIHMVQACRERIAVLRAEIETLEKMLAAIGAVP